MDSKKYKNNSQILFFVFVLGLNPSYNCIVIERQRLMSEES